MKSITYKSYTKEGALTINTFTGEFKLEPLFATLYHNNGTVVQIPFHLIIRTADKRVSNSREESVPYRRN